jgi:hypothetical protein
MKPNMTTARIVGILFIVGTVAGVLSFVFTGSTFSEPNYLVKMGEKQNQIVIASLLVLTMGFSLAMVPAVLFPTFKKYNEALALGAVIFRGALEAILYMASVVGWLLLLNLSREYVKAGAAEVVQFQMMGTQLLEAVNQIEVILRLVFSLGALMIYYLFFQSKLIPRWLSIWGLIGAVMYFTSGLTAMFRVDTGILMAPLGVQEMVMAGWLMIKGFRPVKNTSSIV